MVCSCSITTFHYSFFYDTIDVACVIIPFVWADT